MDRRNFLKTLIGGVALAGAVRTWPFRVYSFPSTVIAKPTMAELIALQLEQVRDRIPLMFECDRSLLQAIACGKPLGRGSGSSWIPS